MPQSIAQSSYYAILQQISLVEETESLLMSESGERNLPFKRNRKPAHKQE